MDPAESRALKAQVLQAVGTVLGDDLAAELWGRVLVGVVRGDDGEPRLAGIDVEEVLGDEASIDAAFGGERARAFGPALAKGVETLCALEGLDLDEVGGGTFVRLPGAGFGWLPGLVHAPSAALDGEREALMAGLRTKHARLEATFGFPALGRAQIDLAAERLYFRAEAGPVADARATLLGTFAPRSRTWGWGGSHPNAPERVRRASAALVDGILERGAWELATPVFSTDEATAWVLAAFVLDRTGGDGVLCSREGGGLVFFLLRDFRAAGGGQRG